MYKAPPSDDRLLDSRIKNSTRLNKSTVSGHRSGFKVGAVTCFFCFVTNREIRDTCIRRDQISHYTKYNGWGRPHKSGKRSYPYVKSRLKHRIPIGHGFIATKKEISKCRRARVWGDARGDQKPETFCWGLMEGTSGVNPCRKVGRWYWICLNNFVLICRLGWGGGAVETPDPPPPPPPWLCHWCTTNHNRMANLQPWITTITQAWLAYEIAGTVTVWRHILGH